MLWRLPELHGRAAHVSGDHLPSGNVLRQFQHVSPCLERLPEELNGHENIVRLMNVGSYFPFNTGMTGMITLSLARISVWSPRAALLRWWKLTAARTLFLKHGNQFVICATNRPDQDLYVVFDYMELDADSFSWPSFIVVCVPSGWFAVTVATVCHKGPTCRRLSWATCTCPSCLRKIVECKSLHPKLQD